MNTKVAEDLRLTEELEELRRAFEADETFPDVVAAWEAIQRITAKNQKRSLQGTEPYPLPAWINGYLLRCAHKIGRLSFGIAPGNDKPLPLMLRDGDPVGALRGMQQSDGKKTTRFRDERSKHIGAALGFVKDGWTAFQRHDQIERDESHLRIRDNPDIADNKPLQREVRSMLYGTIKKQEGITDEAIRNRLSKARARRRPKEGGT